MPDDSEFCQYCGSKIESGFVVSTDIIEKSIKDNHKSKINDVTPDEALNEIIKFQAKETVKMMEANSRTQPNNEGDTDFGLVPEKPIYTLALMSVDGEREYLNKLYTANGQKIKYKRRGSMSVEGINGMIDIYDTFLPSGQPYKTIYVNMYGAKKSTKAPNGFAFARSKTVAAPNSDVKVSKSNTKRKNLLDDKLIYFTNISSVILTSISIFSIIIAMSIQDAKRNEFENWSPTAVYTILLLIFGAFLGFAINSFIKSRFKLISCLSTIPVCAAIITFSEGSITSWYYYLGYSRQYINNVAVDVFNIIWFLCAISVLIITLIPAIGALIKHVGINWHQSISYREKCYKRVAKMHNYLEKGIITEEEYEKTKRDILKHIC